jgi:hypothetical protein
MWVPNLATEPLPEWLYRPWQLVPDPYWGYLFLAFVILGFAAVLYGFYLMATDPTLGNEPQYIAKKKGGKK